MNLKEHRLYQHLSEPVRLVGLTKDEIFLGLLGFIGAVFYSNIWVRGLMFLSSILGVWALKRFKKSIKGFSFMSWIHWKFGIGPKDSQKLPHSSQRRWLS
ncbi:type IV conjugative transfer system protein TraL [Candidatus Nucleicultrix amoebiphila]|uniref:Conjugal transfer protein TraL n=1 Tax=Candidatus Nucleicultrix amoebiphila FS5 TaxID=1414854 RepID=A0A1W6N4R3_9PROT|nr:hypothetical protein GQ61_05070 [Candidatus Nucleicultrix amoebiphila FS5]